MAPLAQLVAHGGVPGAIAEGMVALVVVGVLVAVWMRERKSGADERKEARLRDDGGTRRR